jgi:hypothetical protein
MNRSVNNGAGPNNAMGAYDEDGDEHAPGITGAGTEHLAAELEDRQ